MFLSVGMVVSFAAANAVAMPNPTVDRMTFHYASWQYNPNPGNMLLLHFPETFFLADGTSWNAGAGVFQGGPSVLADQSVVGDTIRYTMELAEGKTYLTQYKTFDVPKYYSAGTLAPYGPMVIEATIGSATAALDGYVLIESNHPDVGWPDRFNYYSAEVGQIVPFTATYTLLNGQTWDTGIFGRAFRYQLEATVDFTSPVPEPSAVAGALGLLAFGALRFARPRRASGMCRPVRGAR
ncbi:MAG: hypothetical protein JW809_15245 [Pirellulales bacterium]|nr:hypothetical protein [Pirellulales bacterium]